MGHSLRAEDQRRTGDPVRLAVQRDLQLRVQIVRISRVAAEKANQLIILVYMFIKDGVTLRHGKVPGRVHLERTGTDIVVDPQDALGEFSVDLLKFRRAGVRLGQLLDDEPAGPSLVVLKHIHFSYPHPVSAGYVSCHCRGSVQNGISSASTYIFIFSFRS